MVGSVADASVLAAFVFNEPRADEARSLLSGGRLHEPMLLGSELASVCRKKIQRLPGLRTQLLASLDIGLSLDIAWVDVHHTQVVELALDSGLTTYDATYLWLARSLGLPLLTFDEELRLHSGP